MKINAENLEKLIKEKAAKFGESGVYVINCEGKNVLSTAYGFCEKGKENSAPVMVKSRFSMPLDCTAMLALCLFVLIDKGKLKLSDKISKFLPEFEHGDKITLRNLLGGKSGIRDFYFGEILVKLDGDEEYNALTDLERRKFDMSTYLKDYSFEVVLKYIGGKELEHEPGTECDFSLSERYFLREIVERVSGVFLEEFAEKQIFIPLKMTETEIGKGYGALPLYALYRNKEYLPYDIKNSSCRFFTTTAGDMEKLMLGIFEHRLFSKKLWKAATKAVYGEPGLGFYCVNGTPLLSFDFENFDTAAMYFDEENEFCYLRLNNSKYKGIAKSDSESTYFPREMRRELEAFFTYPKNTRMVPYNEKSYLAAMQIEIKENQREFVSGALETIAISSAQKTHRLFVQMEGLRAVGLLDLCIDKKTCTYNIETVIIDRRYQGRGFGKIMLRYAVEYLKREGAKNLTIGVNRFNTAAINLYKSIGFTENFVYQEGIILSMEL